MSYEYIEDGLVETAWRNWSGKCCPPGRRKLSYTNDKGELEKKKLKVFDFKEYKANQKAKNSNP